MPAPVAATSSSVPAAKQGSAAPPSTDAGAGAAYPVGRTCSTPAAIAREKRDLPPADRWSPLVAKDGIRVRVPPDVFRATEGKHGLELVSSVKAGGLGPDGTDERPFAIRFRRLARSVDDLLRDADKTSPLAGIYVEGAFPKRTLASFEAQPEEPMRPNAAVRGSVAGRPAWIWLNGVEGYNSDYVLVELGPKDSLLVVADWNSAVMLGQPECWQRAVIGGVVDSVTIDAAK